MKNKVIANENDKVGLIFYNTVIWIYKKVKTCNPLGFESIFIVDSLDGITAEKIKKIK